MKVLLSAVYCGTEPSAQVQLAMVGEPTYDVDELGHDVQLLPSAAENVFAWHAWHATAPRCEDEPGGQAWQPPVLFKKLPASHGRQPVRFGML